MIEKSLAMTGESGYHRHQLQFQVLRRASFGKWDWVAETLDAGRSEVFRRFERYDTK